MQKKILLIGLLAAMLVLSGCVKINLREDIGTDSMSKVTMKLDYSIMANMPTPPDQPATVPDPCANVEANPADSPLKDVTCEYKDYVATITAKFDRSDSEALSIEDGKYRLDILKAIAEFSGAQAGDQSLPNPNDPQQKQQIDSLKAMGFEYTYTVKLPGIVTSHNGEPQSDGSVKFDVLDLPEAPFVESTTTGLLFGLDPIVVLVVAGVAIAVLVIALIVLLRR